VGPRGTHLDEAAGSETDETFTLAGSPGTPSEVTTPVPDRYLRLGPAIQEKLQHAHELLGHSVRANDDRTVIERALDLLIERETKRKYGAGRPCRAHGSDRTRHIPAAVRKAIYERDGGRCTFVGAEGQRCGSRMHLEFDHVVPWAMGGASTEANLRLRCRTHNQWEAKRAFGAEFIHGKRERRRLAAATSARHASVVIRSAEDDPDRSVIPWLRSLGVRPDQARRAAVYCEGLLDAPIEERVLAALAFLGRANNRPGIVRSGSPLAGHVPEPESAIASVVTTP
jgi:5-methylcytosine-specific restriction endonuclease McrA